MKRPHFLAPLLDHDPDACRLLIAESNVELACRIETAFESKARKRGLLGRSTFPTGSAIVIAPCNAVHTFWMEFPIDVLFVDRQGRLLNAVAALRPWRLAACVSAFAVIELPAHTAARHALGPGDRVVVVRASGLVASSSC
jgi:uncharacterized membrane protein (UPF0127 family)